MSLLPTAFLTSLPFSKYSLHTCVRQKGSSLTLFPSSFQWLFLCCQAAASPVTNLRSVSCVFHGNVLPGGSVPPVLIWLGHTNQGSDPNCSSGHTRAPVPWDPQCLGHKGSHSTGCRFVSGGHKIHWIITQAFTAPTDFRAATLKASSKRRAMAIWNTWEKIQRLAPGHKVLKRIAGDGTDYCLHVLWLVLLRTYKLFWKWGNLIFVLCTQSPPKGVSQS